LVPTFNSPRQTSDGFSISVSNFDSQFTYGVISSRSGAVASINSSTGRITVTNVPAGTASTVTVTTTRSGYTSGSSVSPSYQAISAGNIKIRWNPSASSSIIWSVTDTAAATRVSVENNWYSTGVQWKNLFALAGSEVTMAWKITDASGSPLSNFPITLTVNPGFQDTTGTVTTSTGGVIPQRNGDNDGLNTYLTSNDTGDITYSFINTNTLLNGEAAPADRNSAPTGKIATQMLIYQGTFANSTARLASPSVQLSQDSDITEIHWIKSIPNTLTAAFGTPSARSDGFTLPITNYDASYTWSGTNSLGGAVSIDSTTGLITVSGITTSGSSTVTITTSAPGFETGTATSSSISTGSNPAAPLLAGHVVGELLWSDEFNGSGTTIDNSNWTARECGGDPSNGGSTCMNNEQQSYRPSAVTQNGASDLIITATHTPSGAPGTCLHSGGPCTFTSGRLDTQGKKSFKYGYIEARIKTPVGSGNWPAFWMLGDSITSIGWPSSGEIDIMEQWRSNKTRTSAANHYRNTSGNHQYEYGEITNGPDYALAYHTYGLGWTPGQMSFYVDGVLFFRESKTGTTYCGGPANQTQPDCTASANPWPFDDPFFLILNNAISDQIPLDYRWDGWATSTMAVDYVRAYALDGYGEVIPNN
jgi:beta-glucanase (GH16 family)